jgi:fructose-bisphosphate aldolase class 1
VTFIDGADDMRQTALHRACLRNHGVVIELLLDAGANPLAQDLDGKTPLATPNGLDERLRQRMQEAAAIYRLGRQEG